MDPKSLVKEASSVKDSMNHQDVFIDPKRERRLTRKLDLFIAPIMTVIFLNAYLDRANIGNAASAGMLEDLHMTDGQLGSMFSPFSSHYSLLTLSTDAITLFYVTYVTFEIPCSLALKKFHPSTSPGHFHHHLSMLTLVSQAV